MALTPFNVEGFGGLRLDLDPVEAGLGNAIDLLNVDLDREGRVRSRDGFLKATAAAGATRYDSLFPLVGSSVASVVASPATAADDSSHGTVAWTNPTNIASGGTSTITLTTGQVSHYLKATNFGFAVPASAIINGIVLTRTLVTTNPRAIDESVRLLQAGVAVGSDYARSDKWPGVAASTSRGGSSDLWGATWTPTQVNASTFGTVFAAQLSAAGTATGSVSAVTISVYYTAAGSAFIASATAGRIDVVKVDGTIAATLATASDAQQSYIAFGSPAANATYIANTGSTVRKLVGTTFSTPAGMPRAKFVGLQTPDNRLVAANITTIPTGSGATASTSLVHFAGGTTPGTTPETWGANDYVYLTPGDGEDIQGLASYQNQLFIFKSTKLFVFYGNSTDTTGNPVFNYRQVSGAGLAARLAVASSPGGIYFLDRRGVYLTTGGSPVKISQAVDTLFTGGTSAFYQSGQVNPSVLSSASMAWYNDRLYIGLALGTSATNDHTLVYDPKTGQWSLWDIPMGAMAASASQPGVLYFVYATGTNDVGQWQTNASTTDNGVAITSRYQSGFSDLGAPGQEKTVRQTELIGQGVVSLAWARDMGTVTTTSTASVTLGTAPASLRTFHRLSQNGEVLSWQASATTAWQLNRITPMVRPVRQPGDKSA